jgi:hypothetical protein
VGKRRKRNDVEDQNVLDPTQEWPFIGRRKRRISADGTVKCRNKSEIMIGRSSIIIFRRIQGDTFIYGTTKS